MSTNKRQNSPNIAAEGTNEARFTFPRKRSRLSSLIEVGRDGERVNPTVIRHGTYGAPSVPLQPFRVHNRPIFVSEGARPPNRNKRATFRHRQPPVLPILSPPYSPNSLPYSGRPELFDVTFELPDAISPVDGEMSYWRTDHAAFIKSAAGLEDGNWIGKRPLGFGTFGTAGLWERRDENNVMIEVLWQLPCPIC